MSIESPFFTFVKPSDSNLIKSLKLALERIMALDTLQNKLQEFCPSEHSIFWRETAASLNLQIHIKGAEGLNLDPHKPLIVVTNHPRGLLDGISVGYFVESYLNRCDLKFIANEIIEKVFPQVSPFNIPVNNMSSKSFSRSLQNSEPLLKSLRHLKGGGVIALHPAGEVSEFQFFSKEGICRVSDCSWDSTYIELARRAQCSILPIHISGCNSLSYQITSFLGSHAKRVLNFREFLKGFASSIELNVGPLITEKELDSISTSNANLKIRQRVYNLQKIQGPRGAL